MVSRIFSLLHVFLTSVADPDPFDPDPDPAFQSETGPDPTV